MKKLMLLAVGLLAISAIGCSNSGGSSSRNNNSGYTFTQYGTCVNSSGQQVPSTYCYNSGTGVTQQCYGTYYFFNGSTWLMGSCNGMNCSGYTLYNTAGQQVRCL